VGVPGWGVIGAAARGVGGVAVWSGGAALGVAGGVGQVVSPPVVGAVRAVSGTGRGVLGAGLTVATAGVGVATALLGSSESGTASVAWSSGRRLHLDLPPVVGAAGQSAAVAAAAREVPGVASAHVEGALHRLVVDRDSSVDPDTVHHVAQQAWHAAGGDRPGRVTAGPAADPGDPLAVAVPALAAVADVAAVVGAVAGRVARWPAAPRAAQAAVAVIQHQPRVVGLLEARVGRVGADVLINTATAAAHGFGQSPAAPLLDLAQRSAQVLEALAHRAAWARREPVLAAPHRPQAPPVPVLGGSDRARRSSGLTRAGEASHVMVDAAVDVAVDSAKGAVSGVVESYVEQAAGGSLVAAAGALLASGRSADVADAVLAGVPKAAQLGREVFAAVLGRGLARRDLVVLDPGALRRLDRVAVVVVDGAALRGDARQVLQAHGRAGGWDDDRVFQVADALLHGERAPEPDAGELSAVGARLRRRRDPAGTTAPADGAERHDLVCGGEVVGAVSVGWELDPYAAPLLATARRSGARVVLRHVAGTEELGASVDAGHPAGTPLLQVVRALREDRGPVLLVGALHPDFASQDTLAALAVSDVGVALDDPRAAAPWTADIITGPDLAAVVRVISALPAARRASSSAVRLAKAGTTLAGLLLVTEEGGSRGRVGLSPWLDPVNASAATAVVGGALTARGVLGLPDPDPQPLTAWHALDPEVVYARLTGGPRPLAADPVESSWRRRSRDLIDAPGISTVRGPAREVARLLSATRGELSDPLTPVLAVGAAASAILGSSVDAVLVAAVMGVNAFVGGAQRMRAENAAAELFAEQQQFARRVVIPATATPRGRLAAARSGSRTVVVPATRLRPGDVIVVKAPDVVPADARLLISNDLEVDESSLTGESLPVDKKVEATPSSGPSDRACMVFEGGTVVAGDARAIVVATGGATAARRAIDTVAGVGPPVGVQARLSQLTSKALPLTLAGGAAVTGLSLLRRRPLRDAVADGVAIAVAAVPEGLPLVATLAQLAAARRLTGQGVLVRTPRTLEALGRVDTVCFDKTGTLTENRLRLVAVTGPDTPVGGAWPTADNPVAATVLRAAVRACPRPEHGQGHAHATDEAILQAAAGTPDADWQPLLEVPFESSRGYAATLGTTTGTGGGLRAAASGAVDPTGDSGDEHPAELLIKGAPEVILDRCHVPDRAQAHALVHALADDGLRVLAVARREVARSLVSAMQDDAEAIDGTAVGLELLGYVGLADTPRPSARPLLGQLVDADLTVVLITGDHPVTARAIGRQLGLPADARVVTGADLAGLDEQNRADLAAGGQIFARISPEQKAQVVAALQHAGRVTAMVGDGANDAAAIRQADVGVGVTSRGSSAARGAADIVLTEDDLSVLLDALVEGRTMWGSVRDALAILLGGNAGEVAFTVLGTAIAGRAPVSTRQLLLVNLLTDMFPALAVAVTPQHGDALPDPDADPREARDARRRWVLAQPTPSLDRPLIQTITTRGAATAAGATLAWQLGRLTPGTARRSSTMGLTALVGTQLAQTLFTRWRSLLVITTAAGSAAVLLGVVQTPGISHFFGCTPLGPVAWAQVLTATAAATAAAVLAPHWLARLTSVPEEPQSTG